MAATQICSVIKLAKHTKAKSRSPRRRNRPVPPAEPAAAAVVVNPPVNVIMDETRCRPVRVLDGDNITTAEPINHRPVPPTEPAAAAVAVNPPVDVIMDETRRRPKRAIRPRVQSDQATMDYNDCANSDCDDPKRPGDLIMCAGLGCQTKVLTTLANLLIGF